MDETERADCLHNLVITKSYSNCPTSTLQRKSQGFHQTYSILLMIVLVCKRIHKRLARRTDTYAHMSVGSQRRHAHNAFERLEWLTLLPPKTGCRFFFPTRFQQINRETAPRPPNPLLLYGRWIPCHTQIETACSGDSGHTRFGEPNCGIKRGRSAMRFKPASDWYNWWKRCSYEINALRKGTFCMAPNGGPWARVRQHSVRKCINGGPAMLHCIWRGWFCCVCDEYWNEVSRRNVQVVQRNGKDFFKNRLFSPLSRRSQ